MHGRHGRLELGLHHGRCSPTLTHVSIHATGQPDLGRRIHEDRQIETPPEFRHSQDQDPVDHHYGARLHPSGPSRPGVAGEVVDRHVDRPTGQQAVEMVDQQRLVQRVRMVVVDDGPPLDR